MHLYIQYAHFSMVMLIRVKLKIGQISLCTISVCGKLNRTISEVFLSKNIYILEVCFESDSGHLCFLYCTVVPSRVNHKSCDNFFFSRLSTAVKKNSSDNANPVVDQGPDLSVFNVSLQLYCLRCNYVRTY